LHQLIIEQRVIRQGKIFLLYFLDKTSLLCLKHTYTKIEAGLQSIHKWFIECDPACFLCARKSVVRSEWQWETAAAAVGNAV